MPKGMRGFQPGHAPFYTAGAVPGHAPTNVRGNPESIPKTHAIQRARGLGFDQPLGSMNRAMGSFKPKSKAKERECLEAIQNGKIPRELATRFPSGMIVRLAALHEVATDPDHKDFMNAQRLVREILGRRWGGGGEDDGPSVPAGDRIEVFEGRIDIPMPGASYAPVPGAAGGVQPAGAEVGHPVAPATNGNGKK